MSRSSFPGVHFLVLLKVWSVTTGALLDWIGAMDSVVSSLAVHQRMVISASFITNYVKIWHLDYNTKYRSKSSIPAYCPQVVLSKGADTVYYIKEGNKTEVYTWNCSEGETCHIVLFIIINNIFGVILYLYILMCDQSC